MRFIVLAAAMSYGITTLGQSLPQKGKSSLDEESYKSWISLEDVGISDNGEYAFYFTDNLPKGSKTMTVTGTNNKRKIDFLNANSPSFSGDNKHLFFKVSSDTLINLNLETFKFSTTDSVSDFRVLKQSRSDLLIIKSNNKLLIKELNNKWFFEFNNVVKYLQSKNGKIFLISEMALDKEAKNNLIWLDIENQKQYLISNAHDFVNASFSDNDRDCAFLTESINGDKVERKLFLYTQGDLEAKLIIDGKNMNDSINALSRETIKFNQNGNLLFFKLLKLSPVRPKINMAEVNVWNYKDKHLQSEQLARGNENLSKPKELFAAVYNIRNQAIIKLENDNEEIVSENFSNNYSLVQSLIDNRDYYKREYLPSLDLVLNATGARKRIINSGSCNFLYSSLTPDEKFIVWFDLDKLAWYSYDISSGTKRNLSSRVSNLLYDTEAFRKGIKGPWGFAGWMPAENAILLYDQYDIWKIPLNGNGVSVNLTNRFGEENGLTLRIVTSDNYSFGYNSDLVVNNDQHVIVAGYNRQNKLGGYWDISFSKPKFSLDHLNSYSISSRLPIGNYWQSSGIILKAKKSDKYLVVREKAEESRNLYFTSDLKNYDKLSSICPEKEYNWLTAELINWKMGKGINLQGTLYKPGNFDCRKKYPVLFNFYETRSDELHKFLKPDFSGANINIPSFVDQGYLVFVPDTYSFPGEKGVGEYNSIISAAQVLSRLPFVDSTKFGLQGHSYGGGITNYIITHSNRFIAACEAAGNSDAISGFGGLLGNGDGRSRGYEVGFQGSPYGVGVTPWSRPDLYLNSSPIFKIGDINTPLLMMHNKNDGAVPFAQAIELFTGMRRAGKKVWLLEYDNSGHELIGEAAKDFHIRMLQFFNYYLKGKPAPVWMTTGIPAYLKGSEDGLELDKSGIQP